MVYCQNEKKIKNLSQNKNLQSAPQYSYYLRKNLYIRLSAWSLLVITLFFIQFSLKQKPGLAIINYFAG